MGVIIRRATAADAEAVAAVHVLGWQQGYSGLLPDSYLAQLEVQPAVWSERLRHEALRAAGFVEAMLWVLTDNRRAIAFYERQGWQAENVWREESLDGSVVRERRYRHPLVRDPQSSSWR